MMLPLAANKRPPDTDRGVCCDRYFEMVAIRYFKSDLNSQFSL